MRGREEQARDEGEVVDEEAELGLIAGPTCWPMEGEGKE
jgi:hypothetical protein